MKSNWDQVAKVIKRGGVAIIPTDTQYGIVGDAYSRKTVERIYKLKGRNKNKPLIVLISSLDNLKKFGVKLSQDQKEFVDSIWPGKVSVILQSSNPNFKYLHRGTKAIAFRMIGQKNRNLYNLLKKTGPIVAPSANPQGAKPARNMWEAKKYFGDNVDIYECGHTRVSKPSTLVSYKNRTWKVLRKGAVKI